MENRKAGKRISAISLYATLGIRPKYHLSLAQIKMLRKCFVSYTNEPKLLSFLKTFKEGMREIAGFVPSSIGVGENIQQIQHKEHDSGCNVTIGHLSRTFDTPFQ